jgi:guanylate kinase
MVRRLTARKTETPQDLQLRIETARQELQRMHIFDYYVVNADAQLDAAVDMIEAIIEAEHHRIHPRQVSL